MRNQRKCKLDSLAKTKRMGVLFRKIESDPDLFDDGAGILIVAVPKGRFDMGLCRQRILMFAFAIMCLSGLVPGASSGQQLVQRGALGKPAEVLDDTMQWSTPLLVAGDHDVEIYIPDVTSTDWLKRNYTDFMEKNQYVISFFTFYRNTKACRANQIAWGYSDAAHLDACNDISYRVRQVHVDAHLKTVTLIMAAMIGEDGQVVPSTMERQPISRGWHELDANSQEALDKATVLIAEQMKRYDRKVNGVH
jgi:hypothetical protein